MYPHEFRIRVAATKAGVENTPEKLRGKSEELLAALALLKAGIDPDKYPELVQEAIGKTLQIEVKLSEIPYGLVGKTAEILAQFKLLEFGIDSHRYPSKTPNKDLDAFAPFVECPFKVPVQVKCCSLRKHGYALYIDEGPLRKFKGWYISVLEREPWDDYLYIPYDKMQTLMDKYGEQPEKTKKAEQHHKNRWCLPVYRYWNILKQYLDSSGLVKAVLDAKVT